MHWRRQHGRCSVPFTKSLFSNFPSRQVKAVQVSSYLKNAQRSMRHKLIGYMIALAVLLVAALCTGLFLFGRLSSPKSEIQKTLDLQMEVFQNDMESLWRNVSIMSIHLSEDMTMLLEDTLLQQGISFDDLDGNVDATKAVEDAMLEPLSQYVRQADCSGAFIILESSMSGGDTADARSGLYVQKANAGRVTNDLLLFRGIASVGKAHSVMPHRKWAQEFHIEQFPNYAEHITKAAAPIADSRRTTDLVTLPGTSEKAILLTIPMIGADGTLYGMCGFSVNQSFFSAHYDQPSNLSHLACLLTAESDDALDAGAALMTYTEDGFCYVPPETLTVKPMYDGLVSLSGNGFSFVGMVENLTTAKGDGTPHTLAVLIPKEDYNIAVAKNILQTALLSALLLFFTIVCCLYLARRYLAPVHRDLERLRDEDRGGEQMAFSDFEPISATLQAQDRENEKIITTLEEEKQTVQEQAVRLLDKNEELQGQFEAAQADAQRLAYSRKSEIDPAIYEMFLVGYETLTPTEREIFEALADGISSREIARQRTCSENTIATHRKNIYRKLGIHRAYQLKLCIALLRQDQEAQN